MSEEKKEAVAEEQVSEATEIVNPNPVDEQSAQETDTQEEATKETEKSTADEPKPEPEKSTAQNDDYEEIVVDINDLEEEKEYPEAEMETLTRLYDQTMSKISEGEIVNGRVLNITDNGVIIDIGFKSEGIVPLEEFDNIDEIKPGDEIEVYLETLESSDGQLTLSRRKADFIRIWEKLVEKHENDEVIPGTITRRIKGGMVVNLMGVDAFLPGSQIDVKPIRDFDAYLGKQMNFKIVKVNHARKNIVVSSRVLIEKEMESQRKEILDTLERGQVRKGTVKNITDFGVFIDLGGVDGLLHITDLSWGRVNHPSELVKLDQELEVMILDFNEEKDRISLGLKQLQAHPWENVEEKYPVGSTIKGRVVSLTDYGAFVELEKGIEGLIHISEMSWSQHIKHPSQLLTVGQEIEAVVLNIEPDAKKISLGLKQLEPDPWENIEERYPVGSVHKGQVRNLTQFGAFVELEEGIDGLVHISDLSWTKKVRHPSEIVKKGDEIEVVVLGINREERRIALGHKQIDANPWDSFEENYKVGTETNGKIARIIEKGIIVTLPLGVDGFIPNQHLGLPKGKKASDVYEVGSEIPAKVIEFDKENKKIVLSVSAYFSDRERKEFEDYLASQGASKTTLAEVAKTTEAKDSAKEEEKPKKKEQKEEETASEEPESGSEPEATVEAKEEKTEEKPEEPETATDTETQTKPEAEAEAEEKEKAEK
ncbi:MAG TPA: 30S ribosomal protein S1 [Caldithrix abyssi]|uniref:Small ribosomal subunit protein bS1 n=1 Tax=Caldithrix abyssi TaxID=187145 RepID=A0A7V4U2K3_CALAY|nr:30S ribosomal protein S1 [Caldithrix abyssi]